VPRSRETWPEASKHNYVVEPAKSLFKPRTKLADQVLHAQVLPAINAKPTNAFLAISSIRSLSTTLLRVQPLDKIVSNCAKNMISFRAMGYKFAR
jgi:hypothetical protein